MPALRKTFCCRFELFDGFFTPMWINGKTLTKTEARAWAKKKVADSPKKYKAVHEVYEVIDEKH